MPVDYDNVWASFGTRNKSKWDKETTVYCLHCGITVSSNRQSMTNHLSQCKSYLHYSEVSQQEDKSNNVNLRNTLQLSLEDEGVVRLRMGVIGIYSSYDLVSMYITSFLLTNRFDLVCGYFSSSMKDADDLSQVFHISRNRSYTQLDTMFKKESERTDHSKMQCVTITTSNDYRFTDALNALKHGVHVMCQSPICFTEEEAVTLYKTAHSNGLVFHIANPYCFYGMIQIAKKLVHNYVLGEITDVHITHLCNQSICDIAANKFPPNPMKIGVSNCTAELAIPAYELLRFVVDKPIYRLMACLCTLENHVLDDYSFITLEMETGAFATIRTSKVALLHDHQLTLQVDGSLGSLFWNSETSSSLQLCLINGKTEEITAATVGEFHGISVSDYFRGSGVKNEGISEAMRNMYGCFYAEVISLLRGKKTSHPAVTIREGLESMLFLSSCVTSNMHSNSWVEMAYPSEDGIAVQ